MVPPCWDNVMWDDQKNSIITPWSVFSFSWVKSKWGMTRCRRVRLVRMNKNKAGLTVMDSVMFWGVEDPLQRSKVSDHLKTEYSSTFSWVHPLCHMIFFFLYVRDHENRWDATIKICDVCIHLTEFQISLLDQLPDGQRRQQSWNHQPFGTGPHFCAPVKLPYTLRWDGQRELSHMTTITWSLVWNCSKCRCTEALRYLHVEPATDDLHRDSGHQFSIRPDVLSNRTTGQVWLNI